MAVFSRTLSILPLAGVTGMADHEDMFDPYCEHHRSRVLLSNRRIRSIVNRADGIDVHFVCICGKPGLWRTGARR